MDGISQRPQTAIDAAAPHAPSSWHDLKRDWQRWSRAERIAAECTLALVLVTAAVALTSLSF